MTRLTGFLSISLGLTFGAAAELAETDYGDWSVRCDDKNYCIADTQGTGSNDEAFRLKVERGAKADSAVYVTLRPKTPLEVGMLARIEIEGSPQNYGFFGKADKIYTGNEMTFGGPADRELVERLRLGKNARIQIEYGNPSSTITYRVSLTGITHALLRMDREQDRIGKTDAIVARGGLPASEDTRITAKAPPLPPTETNKGNDTTAAAAREEEAADAANASPPPPPATASRDSGNEDIPGQVFDTSKIPDTVLMQGYRVLDCQLDEVVPAMGAFYYAAGDVEVWVVPCQMADANIPYFMVTHIPFNPSLDELAEFETPPDHNQPNHALVNNLHYDPVSGNVTGTTYFSPNYDCGTFEKHEQNGEDGSYTLMEYYEKSDCDGIPGPPEGWPLSWTIDEMGG